MAMELEDTVLIAISTLGFITVSKQIFCLFKWAWAMFLRTPKNLKDYGQWAIVTGSTDGIGKATAFELAAKGLHLVLVGRNPSKLQATANEIHAKYGKQVEIKSIVIDFAKCCGEDISKAIEEGIKGLDVGILVNNAGLAYPYARYFHEVDSELLECVIKVNADAATWMVRSVLPIMLKKKKGAIVNVGSGSSIVLPSYPLYTVYAATKAYLAMFSRCINLEYKRHGIDVQCQVPLFVATKMSRMRKTRFLIATPKMYAKSSMKWIGYEHLCIPMLSHSIQGFVIKILPNALMDWCIFRFLLGMRKRGRAKEGLRN